MRLERSWLPRTSLSCYTGHGTRTPRVAWRGVRRRPEKWQIAAREGRALEPVDVAKTIVDVAADKKAADVTMIDIRELSVIADYFVICTGANRRQIQAIASAIDDKMGDLHVNTRGREGNAEGGWVLLDYGDVIVHIFGPMEREFYRLERLWSEAPTVVYLQ